MALTTAQLAQQKKQAEELLFSGPESLGFAKNLFFGRFQTDQMFPYPTLSPDRESELDQALEEVRTFALEHIDPDAIDRNAEIPQEVIDELGELGVMGMTAPPEFGGMGFNQSQYVRIMELIGGHCASTSVFVNAHHSIGIRALLLFGTPEQQREWLPSLVHGRRLAAFALTEPEAGSDASNVQTRATPTEDGSAYILNGEKRYITNGAVAGMLTVMARTPNPDNPKDSKVTAFIVSPDMPGFEVIQARAEKCGIRGTATGRLRFHDIRVPKENVLGPVGKGLKVALTVLDFGRITFGAACTGAAKFCLRRAVSHVKHRVQFQQPLAEFEMVQKKIAWMAAHAFAMDAATTQCAALIDSGGDDYMLETAILKVFATEHLWTIVNDTIQLHGGQAYFCDEPFERMMRDARINTIGEGANEVLKAFIAVVGCRAPGMRLDLIRKTAFSLKGQPRLWRFMVDEIGTRLGLPRIPVKSRELRSEARQLAKLIKRFGTTLPWVFMRAGSEERFIQSQLQHERLADIAIDLYVSSCVLSRLDHLLSSETNSDRGEDVAAGRHFLKLAGQRIRANMASLWNNDDTSTTTTARVVLSHH